MGTLVLTISLKGFLKKFWGFHDGLYSDCGLLGCDTMYYGKCVPTCRRNMLPQSSSLKMTAACSSEMSAKKTRTWTAASRSYLPHSFTPIGHGIARTLRTWVQVPLEAWLPARVSFVFLFSCAGSGLAEGLIPHIRRPNDP
jgi:hypothetical protein